jgi:hypothetical protein
MRGLFAQKPHRVVVTTAQTGGLLAACYLLRGEGWGIPNILRKRGDMSFGARIRMIFMVNRPFCRK